MNLTLDCKSAAIENTKDENHPIRIDINGIDPRDIRDNAEELLNAIGQDTAERYWGLEKK